MIRFKTLITFDSVPALSYPYIYFRSSSMFPDLCDFKCSKSRQSSPNYLKQFDPRPYSVMRLGGNKCFRPIANCIGGIQGARSGYISLCGVIHV